MSPIASHAIILTVLQHLSVVRSFQTAGDDLADSVAFVCFVLKRLELDSKHGEDYVEALARAVQRYFPQEAYLLQVRVVLLLFKVAIRLERIEWRSGPQRD
jgi:hypothetical protein